MSVLERQNAMLQSVYHDRHQTSPTADTNGNAMAMLRYQALMNSMNSHHLNDQNSPNFGFHHACSEITSNNTSPDLGQHHHHHHRSFSTVSATTNSSRDHTKKRKAEFDAEEMECKGKMYEEAGEVQSELIVKSEKENSGKTSKVSEKTDFIHVRARRGQATDNHSIAERARREKISKKMKCLQDLVPGCNKVTGKAGMLDEIINYVQSLQKQVEFLSMKLAVPAYMASFSSAATPLELIQSAYQQYNQGPDPQGSSSCSVDTSATPTEMFPQRNGTTSSLSFPEAYLDSFSSLQQVQQIPTWDSDWESLYH